MDSLLVVSSTAVGRAANRYRAKNQRPNYRCEILAYRLVVAHQKPDNNQDARNAEAVFDLMARLHGDFSLTSLIATHNLDFARRCSRVLKLAGGRLQEVAPELL